ncbi:MAG: hypothetical protein ACXWPS_02185, partial [Ktedonobacteraceae bacterium]
MSIKLVRVYFFVLHHYYTQFLEFAYTHLPYMKPACKIISMKNFWNELQKPIFILAPMDDVTDTVLRQVIARYGKPAVFFTEFTNVEGMFSKGERNVMQRLKY